MIFASTALAARIEAAEARLVAESARSASKTHADALLRPLAGGVAAHVGEGSPFNKVAGLGFGGALDPAELEEVERAFASRGAPVQVEVSTLADPSIAETLTRRGYALVGFEDVLGRTLPASDAAPPNTEVEIVVVGEALLDVWIDTVVDGFAAPDTQGVASHESFPREALERAIRELAASPRVVQYLARRGSAAAGAASLRIDAGVAQLCGAATSPAHRRRGVQTALLTARLAAAAEAGCDVAVLTTQPGSKSQENVCRLGFERLYSRAVLVRDAGGQPNPARPDRGGQGTGMQPSAQPGSPESQAGTHWKSQPGMPHG